MEKGIAKIQAYIKRWKQQRTYIKLKKMMKYRVFVIKEIIQTELNFLNDMNLVNDKIKKPLAHQLLRYNDGSNLFQNIEEIIITNTSFYKAVSTPFSEQYWPNKVIFAVSVDNFRIYFPYCNGYKKSMETMEYLKECDHNYIGFMQENKQLLRGMQLEDFLVKPIQRLTKYVLLFKDLLKNTPQDHPDYKNISKLLSDFEKINTENNENMDRTMNRMQVEEIFKELGRNDLIANQARLLCASESRLIIQQQQMEQVVRTYFFTDLIVLATNEQNGQLTLIKILDLGSQPLVKDQPDIKNFKFLYSVVGKDGVIQFKAETAEQKQKEMKQIQQILDYLTNNSCDGNYPIHVQVVGTEERNIHSLQKHTVYITEITIQKIYLTIYLRYSEIVKLSQVCRERYPNVHIEQFGKQQWFNNHSTKIIEERSIAIENFLQTILSHESSQKDHYLLSMLQLPEDFYQLPIKNNMLDSQMKNNFQMSRDSKQLSDLIIMKKQKTMEENENNPVQQIHNKLSAVVKSYQDSQDKVKINVAYIKQSINYDPLDDVFYPKGDYLIDVSLPNNQIQKIEIKNETRSAEVVKMLADKLKLKFHRDFKLFLLDQYQNSRVIEDDEVISKLVIEDDNVGILKRSIRKIESLFSSTNGQQLLFNKYFYLPHELELIDAQQDPARLNLIVSSFMLEIQQSKYYLRYDHYCLYAALSIKGQNKQLTAVEIQQVVPRKIYSQRTEQEWMDSIKQIIQTVTMDIIQHVTQDKPEHYLCQFAAYKAMLQNKLFGVTQFYVEIEATTLQNLNDDKHIQAYPNIYLGISATKMQLMSPSDKTTFKTLEYSQLMEVRSYPSQIIIQTQPSKWVFNTGSSYEIKKLIGFYNEIAKFI